ncbi:MULTISPECIES: helix-turn-helix domain-containing protein [unclassified Paenibacillus]|uniref:helix-turn-helix domain-containing protein n=1 Tax=unclassified Paenibacillus TaxID=185978 RepID=UPI000C279A4C|nr:MULTISPECIES: helix-turn-helix transcriptional regulator [unclassified Paenibacillus]
MDYTPGELMRIHRTRKDMTQKDLANYIGSFQVRVSRLENGLKPPTPDEIKKIEKVLGTIIWSQQRGDAMNGT